jgi:hypothetical protein
LDILLVVSVVESMEIFTQIYCIIAACLDIISEPPAETLHVHLFQQSPTMVRVVLT